MIPRRLFLLDGFHWMIWTNIGDVLTGLVPRSQHIVLRSRVHHTDHDSAVINVALPPHSMLILLVKDK